MRNLIVYAHFIFAFVYHNALGQADVYRLVEAHPDSVELYQAIVKQKLFNSPDTCLIYLKGGIQAAHRMNQPREEADLYSKYGIWHDVHGGNIDSILYYYNQARGIYQEINELVGYADVLNNIGYAYARRSRFTEALQLYQEALSIYDSLDDAPKYSSTSLNIGLIYQQNDDLEKALEKYKESMLYHGMDTVNQGNFRQLSNIATIYNRQKKYDSAIAIFNKIISYSKTKGDKRALAIVYNNLSTSYLEKGLYELALAASNESVDYRIQLKDSVGYITSLNTISGIYQKMGNYSKAIETASKALRLNERINIPKDKEELLKILAESSRSAGNYKAASNYYYDYVNFKDSLDKVQHSKEIADIMEKYESVQRKQEISDLKIENQQAELEKQQSANQRNILIFLAGILIIAALLLTVLLRTKSRANRLISNSLKEKEVLLKEIHHRVKNNLQVISSLLSLQSRFVEDEAAKAAVNEGQNRVKSMALIHQKLYQHDNLLGVEAPDYVRNLVATLKSAYSISGDQIDINYEIDDLRIDVDTIIPIGLILNELISNAFKYAFPNEAEGTLMISLKEEDNRLVLVVADNGIGTDKEIDQSNSFGMRMIKSLGAKLEAEINFYTQQGMRSELLINKYKLVD